MHQNATRKYASARAKLVRRGKTLRSWALENKYPVGSVYNAVRGIRNGPRATAIRRQLKDFLNE